MKVTMTTMTDQLTAARAIIIRDLLQMWRYRASYIMVMLTAVILPQMYYLQALGFSGQSPQAQESFAQLSGTSQVGGFIYLGWAVLMWVSVILYGPASALSAERSRGTLEFILLSPISRLTMLLASSVAPMVPTVLMFGVVAFFMRSTMQVELGGGDLVTLALVVLISTPALLAIGSMFSSLTVLTRDSGGLIAIAQGVVSILCGVTYPIAVLPEALQYISQALPPTQTILLLREGILGADPAGPVGWRVAYLLLVAVVLIVLSDVNLKLVLARARVTGRLGQF